MVIFAGNRAATAMPTFPRFACADTPPPPGYNFA
jgi:hypothetical protein